MSLKLSLVSFTLCVVFVLVSSVSAKSQLAARDQWDAEACGKPRRDAGLIVGGYDLKHGEYPWIVAFNQTRIGFSYFCGGTLVSLRHVITAAHCMEPKYGETIFDKFEPSEVIALFGAHNLSYVDEPGRLSLSPYEIHVHNQWNPNERSYDADIALLVFESGKIKSSYLIQPICLWSSRNVLAETLGTVVGWGKSSDPNRNHENLPKQLQVPMFTNEECFLETYELAQISSKRTFCAGFRNGTGVCLGDSGSGFFVKSDGVYYLRGIVSSSLVQMLGCDVTKYAIYTNVLKFTNWIAYTMKNGVQPNETAESQDLNFELKQENINSWASTSPNSAKRVSERKCEEYKNIVATPTRNSSKHALDDGFKTYDCGSIGFTGLIVGGTKAKPGEFPHNAAIGSKDEAGKFKINGGGSLISEKYVLTAAHILSKRTALVRLGGLNVVKMDDFNATIDIDIKRFIKHPQHDVRTKENDIGLIELSTPVNFDKKFIRPACLQQKEFHGESFIATGWGKTESRSSPSEHLLKVVIKHQPLSFCADQFDKFGIAKFSVKQICGAGVDNKGTCQGDSGSPLQVPHNDAKCVYDIVAITSFGALCGAGYPEVYIKVSHYLDWIESVVWS